MIYVIIKYLLVVMITVWMNSILLIVFVLSVCHSERLFWAWVDGVIVHDSQTRMDPEKLSKDDVLSFIHQNYQPWSPELHLLQPEGRLHLIMEDL